MKKILVYNSKFYKYKPLNTSMKESELLSQIKKSKLDVQGILEIDDIMYDIDMLKEELRQIGIVTNSLIQRSE